MSIPNDYYKQNLNSGNEYKTEIPRSQPIEILRKSKVKIGYTILTNTQHCTPKKKNFSISSKNLNQEKKISKTNSYVWQISSQDMEQELNSLNPLDEDISIMHEFPGLKV